MSDRAFNPNENKLTWTILDIEAIEGMIKVMMWGASNRGGEENWKKGYNQKDLQDSMMRHNTALIKGEENDPDTGLPHEFHLMCKAMFYSFHRRNKSFLSERSSPFKSNN